MQDNNKDPLAQLYSALAKAQGDFLPLAKNREVEITMSKGGKFKFRYADLEAVLASTRPAMAKHGLSVFQAVEGITNSPGSELVTVLAHEGGGTVRSVMPLPSNNGGDIKNFGATITYLRRYALTSLLCIAADDDLDEDGQGATQRPAKQADAAKEGRRATKPDELPMYPQELFDKNLEARRKGVAEGKTTPEHIISLIESKARLTDEQRAVLLALGGQQ